MSEASARTMPRRGRLWVVVVLALGLLALGYALVGISTQEPGDEVIEIAGVEDAQRLFGGMPQEGDRVGSADAPVTIQVFNDLQCSSCREAYLSTIPSLIENYARPGDVQLDWRHYSNAQSPEQVGFYGAEAAAQQNYGWQYTYLFFRNQDEAEKFGVDQTFLESIAVDIEELNFPEWKEDLEKDGQAGGPIDQRLEGYEELGRDLGIRIGQALILSGPNGSETLQDSPSLAEIEAAIKKVE